MKLMSQREEVPGQPSGAQGMAQEGPQQAAARHSGHPAAKTARLLELLLRHWQFGEDRDLRPSCAGTGLQMAQPAQPAQKLQRDGV